MQTFIVSVASLLVYCKQIFSFPKYFESYAYHKNISIRRKYLKNRAICASNVLVLILALITVNHLHMSPSFSIQLCNDFVVIVIIALSTKRSPSRLRWCPTERPGKPADCWAKVPQIPIIYICSEYHPWHISAPLQMVRWFIFIYLKKNIQILILNLVGYS